MVWRFFPIKRTACEEGEQTTMLGAEQGKAGGSLEDTACPGSCDRRCSCLSQILAGAWSIAGKPQRGYEIQEGHPRVLPAGTPLGIGHPTEICQIAPSKQGWQHLGACAQPGWGKFYFPALLMP